MSTPVVATEPLAAEQSPEALEDRSVVQEIDGLAEILIGGATHDHSGGRSAWIVGQAE